MASFSFGFQGEDIDEDSDNLGPAAQATLTHQAIDQPSEVVTDVPQTHTLREILDLMPAHVAFELIPEMERAHGLRLLRRPLWDVRIQMMQEDQLNGVAPDGLEQGRSLGLGDEDVLRGVYEGGLKSWESSYDLASILQEDLETLLDKYTHFIELGAGTAIPIIVLLRHIIEHGRRERSVNIRRFTVCDFNLSVLRYVTLPNMILNWALVKGRIQPDEDTEADADTDAPGDLELTGGLKDDFWHDLYYYNIHLRFISGPWGTDLFHASEDVDFGWKEAGELSQDRNLILTSETIYSPASLPSLVDTLDIFLPHPGSLCLLAAKQVYFGVGGGIDEFKALMWQRRQGKDQGSIQMSTVKETKGLNGVARVVLRIETGQDA